MRGLQRSRCVRFVLFTTKSPPPMTYLARATHFCHTQIQPSGCKVRRFVRGSVRGFKASQEGLREGLQSLSANVHPGLRPRTFTGQKSAASPRTRIDFPLSLAQFCAKSVHAGSVFCALLRTMSTYASTSTHRLFSKNVQHWTRVAHLLQWLRGLPEGLWHSSKT